MCGPRGLYVVCGVHAAYREQEAVYALFSLVLW